MIKFAKIIDEQTKECQVGLGTNAFFYESIGMKELDVEQAYNGKWFLIGCAPDKPEEQVKTEEIADLKAKLAATDYAVIKIAEGSATAEEYAELIKQRKAWRARINELEA